MRREPQPLRPAVPAAAGVGDRRSPSQLRPPASSRSTSSPRTRPGSGGVPTAAWAAARRGLGARPGPDVREVPSPVLRGPLVHGCHRAASPVARRPGRDAGAGERLAALSEPAGRSHGYATVGVTWEHGVQVDDDEITVSVRTLEDGRRGRSGSRSTTTTTTGPTPTARRRATPAPAPTRRRRRRRRGAGQGRAPPTATVPADIELARRSTRVPPPARPSRSRRSTPRELPSAAGRRVAGRPATTGATDATDPEPDDPGRSSATADVTPKPQIFSRAQWGADERMRDKSLAALRRGARRLRAPHGQRQRLHARRRCPRSCAASTPTTRSPGAGATSATTSSSTASAGSGRAGTAASTAPVVGAHTLNYNEDSFAMSAIGNFDDRPARRRRCSTPTAGCSPGSSACTASARRRRARWSTAATFQAINGHRDAGQTACPGRYLYAQVPDIRTLAAAVPDSRSASRARDRRPRRQPAGPTGGARRSEHQARPSWCAPGARSASGAGTRGHRLRRAIDLLAAVRDVDRRRHARHARPATARPASAVYPGDRRRQTSAPPSPAPTRFAGADQMTGVGDFDGDGSNDLVGAAAQQEAATLYPRQGPRRVRKPRLPGSEPWALRPDRGVRRTSTATATPTSWPAHGRQAVAGARRRARALGSRADAAGPLGRLRRDRRHRRRHQRRQARPGRPRSKTTKLRYVYPGNGTGSGFGQRFGAVRAGSRASTSWCRRPARPAPAHDLVGAQRHGGCWSPSPTGAQEHRGAVADTGTSLADTDLVLNVGDWNGDGHGDVMTRSAATGVMPLRAGDGRGRLRGPRASPAPAGARCDLVAAVGDITGDGFPDLMGQPSRRRDADLPRQRLHRLQAQLRGALRDRLDRPDRRSGCGTATARRTACCDAATARSQLYPGNGPGGLTERRPGRVGRVKLRLAGRRGRRGRRRPSGPRRPRADHRRAVAAPGHARRLRAAALRRRRLRRLRPRRLTGPVAQRRPVARSPAPRRTAACHRTRRGGAPTPCRRRASSGASSVVEPGARCTGSRR